MGVDGDLASGTVRLSLGWSSTEADVARAVAGREKAVSQAAGRPVRAA
jgi:cysteine sulfinate desulfinase/cysteine desulfurase-like protein